MNPETNDRSWVRKIKHKVAKFFGFSEDKWARGGGRYGYGRSYGKNKHGHCVENRSRAEIRNADDRKLDKQGDV